MDNTTMAPSIAELARRCSESLRQHSEAAGQELDRRMGAALAVIRERRLLPSPLPSQSASGLSGEDQLLVASPSQEVSTGLGLDQDRS